MFRGLATLAAYGCTYKDAVAGAQRWDVRGTFHSRLHWLSSFGWLWGRLAILQAPT